MEEHKAEKEIKDNEKVGHHGDEEKKELTWCEKLYKPEHEVEPSFFFYKHR